MGEPTEAEHVARIVERLRRDHPDPKMRQQLYDEAKLPDYVRVLMQGHTDDDAVVERIVAHVRDAEDGEPASD